MKAVLPSVTLHTLTALGDQLSACQTRLETLTAEYLPHIRSQKLHDVRERVKLLQNDIAYIADCIMEWECTKRSTRTKAS